MTRHKDVNWNLADTAYSNTNTATVAVLMDIRDELKAIRALQERTLGCFNFVNMPRVIERIDRRIAKNLPLRKA